MINIAICDDENVIVNQIETILRELCGREAVSADIDAFYSGQALQNQVASGTRYDLIFLDIQMQDGDGITAAEEIRKTDDNALLIYVSGYDNYMIELFRLDVFGFIKKPICRQTLEHTFYKAYQRICAKTAYFTFSYKHEEYKILCRDILYLESRGRKIVVALQNGEQYSFNGKLSEAEQRLSGGKIPFLRIHQSYLVNYHLIRARTKEEITLVNGKKLPISEDKRKTFDRQYNRLLGGEING